ncbi:DUF2147 domain-containing protein [Bradyrhizobium sp.]|uniref:DUF2147 domain-containing protein n=1 Tax=Bradyrhizobium sp. TaxID=376 RepID=UPI003C19314E
MKKLTIFAALMLATTAAHAGNSISFEINGKKVHIEAPSHCQELSCLQISAPGLSAADFGFKRTKFASNPFDDDDAAPRADQPAPKSTAAPVDQAAAPQAPVDPAGSAPPPATVSDSRASPPPVRDNVAPSAPLANSSAAPVHTPVAAAPTQTPVAAAPAPATPLGTWATEEQKGMVRIEACGQSLCGYAVSSGEKILINMKPSDAKWTGRIHDPDSGRNYDSTIAMKGPNALRVQGCAFGGLFCGGQTWSRVS